MKTGRSSCYLLLTDHLSPKRWQINHVVTLVAQAQLRSAGIIPASMGRQQPARPLQYVGDNQTIDLFAQTTSRWATHGDLVSSRDGVFYLIRAAIAAFSDSVRSACRGKDLEGEGSW